MTPDGTVTGLGTQGPQGIQGIQGLQGVPGPVAASVANPAALAALDPQGTYPTGTPAYVQSTKASWLLDRTSTATPDGQTVVAANGGGNWIFPTVANHAGNYTLSTLDAGADFDTTAGNLICTMPAAPLQGRPYLVSVGALGGAGHALTIQGNGYTINGGASMQLAGPYASVILAFNGTEYRAY